MVPPRSSAAAVLLASDLLEEIASYQQGMCLDLQLFIRVHCPRRELSNFLRLVPWYEADEDDKTTPLSSLDTIVTPWYREMGYSRVHKLFASLPHMRENIAAHAVCYGILDVLPLVQMDLLRNVPYSLVELAAASGHVKVLEFLLEDADLDECSGEAMIKAAHRGHLDIVRYLHGRTGDDCAAAAVVFAASHGHLEVVKFLHTHRPNVKQLKLAMFNVAKTDDVAVASYILDALGKDRRLPVEVMDIAAQVGHLSVVQLLHKYKLRCSTVAMDKAAANGHLEVVQWLHAHRREGCSEMAMGDAAIEGHLEVVQFLHAQRAEGCGDWTLRRTAANGHWHVVRYLAANGIGGSIQDALEVAKTQSERVPEGLVGMLECLQLTDMSKATVAAPNRTTWLEGADNHLPSI